MASLTGLITSKIVLTGCWRVGKDLVNEKERQLYIQEEALIMDSEHYLHNYNNENTKCQLNEKL